MKVTVLLVIIIVITFTSCKQYNTPEEYLLFQQKLDSTASKQIDSAYSAIEQNCDTAFKYLLPLLIDSLLHMDTTTIKTAAAEL